MIGTKGFDNISKYLYVCRVHKILKIKIARIWHLNTSIIPIVLGARVTIKHNNGTHFKKIQRNDTD